MVVVTEVGVGVGSVVDGNVTTTMHMTELLAFGLLCGQKLDMALIPTYVITADRWTYNISCMNWYFAKRCFYYTIFGISSAPMPWRASSSRQP